jgi:hypothetical protein
MTHYIGYTTLENFAHDARPEMPVNVVEVIEPGKFSKHGLCMVTSLVLATQTAGKDVHYCRIPVSFYQSMDGHTPLFPKTDHVKLARQALAVVEQFLQGEGFDTRSAVVAMPRSLKLLEGAADCLRYDKEQGYVQAVGPMVVMLPVPDNGGQS